MSVNKIKTELTTLERDLKKTYEKLQLLGTESKKVDHVYCYFDSSVILHTDYAFIIASFFVKNISNVRKKRPVILFKVNSDEPFEFSGKYKTTQQSGEGMHFFWEQFEFDDLDSDTDTHYCFRPTEIDQLEPYDQLSFQQFQIRLSRNCKLTVDGFVYFNEENDGIKAINQIDIQE